MTNETQQQPIQQFRYPGQMQWPMTREQQKKAGLIANTNRSIRPRNWSKAAPRPKRGEEAA